MTKYKNQKCEYKFQNEIYKFDSKLEMQHFIELSNRLKRFEIEKLILQPEFQLCEPTTLLTNSTKNGKTRQRAITYVADFSYIEDGKRIVADSKGYNTQIFSLKKKLLLSQLKEHEIDEFHVIYKAETIIYKQKTK